MSLEIEYYIARKASECEKFMCKYAKDSWEMGFLEGYYWCLGDILNKIIEMRLKESKENERTGFS